MMNKKVIIGVIIILIILIISAVVIAKEIDKKRNSYFEYNYELLSYEEYEPYFKLPPVDVDNMKIDDGSGEEYTIVPNYEILEDSFMPEYYKIKTGDIQYVELENGMIIYLDQDTNEVVEIKSSEENEFQIIYSPVGVKSRNGNYYRIEINTKILGENRAPIFKGNIDGTCEVGVGFGVNENKDECQDMLEREVELFGYESVKDFLSSVFGEMIKEKE